MKRVIIIAILASFLQSCWLADKVNENPEAAQKGVELAANAAGAATGNPLVKLIVGALGTLGIGAAGVYGAKKAKGA